MMQKNNCTACGACLNICPKNVVLMQEYEYNFHFQQIDNEKCIHCGHCDKVCKNIGTISKNKYQNSYAIQSKNWDLSKKSSSESLFAGLATLEALMCVSQIVVLGEKFYPIKYYQFDKWGFVCNLYNVKSIKNAILEAYNHLKDISLREEYIKFFSYENVAKMTYEVYRKVINEQ